MRRERLLAVVLQPQDLPAAVAKDRDRQIDVAIAVEVPGWASATRRTSVISLAGSYASPVFRSQISFPIRWSFGQMLPRADTTRSIRPSRSRSTSVACAGAGISPARTVRVQPRSAVWS